MSKNEIWSCSPRWLAVAALLIGTGCKTVVRENIISSINTGIGASITENSQTQLYEVRAGYIRSQFYSIPTGKVVEHSCTNAACVTNFCSNAADKTPELVAGIRVNSSIQHLLIGADIAENFAVGDKAVLSPAAVAMYVALADDPTKAKAASEAAQKATEAIQSVTTSSFHSEMKKAKMRVAFTEGDDALKQKFEIAATAAGYSVTGDMDHPAFRNFIVEVSTPSEKFKVVEESLKAQGVSY